jgi:hypothetical protein
MSTNNNPLASFLQAPNTNKIFSPATANVKSVGNIGTSVTVTSSLSRILAYIAAIIIVLFVILLFVHFFIRPIFRLQPGASGIIPVPGFDDGKLFWTKTSPGQILNKDLPISTLHSGYSINLDVFVQSPLQFERYPRIFFSRGAVIKPTPDGDTLLGVLTLYNLVAALLPDTNDLLVSVLNKDNNMENIIIPNIQVQEPFRLGIILMDNALEVYINGYLMKTRTFSAPPRAVTGDIYPAPGIGANITLVRNLKIWPRILTTSEIRYATPSLSSTKDFGAGPMPSSSSCSTHALNTQTEAQNAMTRFKKLSVDTVSETISS